MKLYLHLDLILSCRALDGKIQYKWSKTQVLNIGIANGTLPCLHKRKPSLTISNVRSLDVDVLAFGAVAPVPTNRRGELELGDEKIPTECQRVELYKLLHFRFQISKFPM